MKHAAQQAASDAIRQIGGAAEMARRVEAPSYQSVQSWRKSGVPVKYCRKVADLTGVALSALRPNDWQDIWPELAQPTTQEVSHG